MQTYILLRCLKQLGHLGLRKPHGLVFQTDLKPDFVVGLVEDDFFFLVQPERK